MLEHQVKLLADSLNRNPDQPVSRILPLLFRLKGRPYGLEYSHFFFEPMFRLKNAPIQLLWKTSRQVSKSTSQAAAQILYASANPDFNVLTVMPFAEQVRKFSSNYVKPFIASSPVKSWFLGKDRPVDAVQQRGLRNRSNLFFSYSSGNPERVRGIPADMVCVDEVQSMDMADLPVIEACMAASPFKYSRYTGTPLTFDNTIQQLWDQSSQAVWHIPCQETGCKHENRCTVDADLLRMIEASTLVCSKCGKPVNSRLGYFVHAYPERSRVFPGYHVSQPILPMHYEDPKAWAYLKMCQSNKPKYAFYNEHLGESFDAGSKLITSAEIAAACTVTPAKPNQIERGGYVALSVGVDWGGRGKEKTTDSEEFISNTAVALAALCSDGSVDIPWLYRVPYSVDASAEAGVIANVCRDSMASWLAMDYGGQGNVQEHLVVAAGWPKDRICPFTYAVMAPNMPIIHYRPGAQHGVRSSYTLDKPRSLKLLIELIRRKMVRFANLDHYRNHELNDFLNIIEESTDSPRGSPRTLIRRLAGRTDDVVHAVNFAVMSLFHSHNLWPELSKVFIDDYT